MDISLCEAPTFHGLSAGRAAHASVAVVQRRRHQEFRETLVKHDARRSTTVTMAFAFSHLSSNVRKGIRIHARVGEPGGMGNAIALWGYKRSSPVQSICRSSREGSCSMERSTSGIELDHTDRMARGCMHVLAKSKRDKDCISPPVFPSS